MYDNTQCMIKHTMYDNTQCMITNLAAKTSAPTHSGLTKSSMSCKENSFNGRQLNNSKYLIQAEKIFNDWPK